MRYSLSKRPLVLQVTVCSKNLYVTAEVIRFLREERLTIFKNKKQKQQQNRLSESIKVNVQNPKVIEININDAIFDFNNITEPFTLSTKISSFFIYK